jgi:hypothetical protein
MSVSPDFSHQPRLTRSNSLKLPNVELLQAKYLTLQKDSTPNAMNSYDHDEQYSEEDSNSDVSELDYENIEYLRTKVDEDLNTKQVQRKSIVSIGSMVTVSDVDALFGSFNRYSSFFSAQLVSTPGVSPSIPTGRFSGNKE